MFSIPYALIAISVSTFIFVIFLALKVLREDQGTDKMKEIADAVKEGADAFLKRQYAVVCIIFAIVFIILLLLSKKNYLSIFVPFAFITGGFFSGLTG